MGSVVLGHAANKVSSSRTETVTVTDKGVKTSSRNSKYLIYTATIDDKVKVYEITDSLLKLRFDSSFLYAKIEVGQTYELDVCGKRVPIFSWYPNVYDIHEITK